MLRLLSQGHFTKQDLDLEDKDPAEVSDSGVGKAEKQFLPNVVVVTAHMP